MVGVASPKQHVGAHFSVKNPNVIHSWLAIRLFHILAAGQYLVLCGTRKYSQQLVSLSLEIF